MELSSAQQEFIKLLNDMTASVGAARSVIRTILEKHEADSATLQMKDGISLLTLKNVSLTSYLNSLALLSSHRALGHTIQTRTPPSEEFTSRVRSARGGDAGDLVDSLVEGRAVLEKAKTMETRMKYQIDKLVRVAKEAQNPRSTEEVSIDPLAFRPNPDNLMEVGQPSQRESGTLNRRKHKDEDSDADDTREGIYKPPQIAPMPYSEDAASRKRRREAPLPTALASLSNYNPSNPYIESTSGLGNDPSVKTNRQRELASMARFEEDNMTRLVMRKGEARRRDRDEQDIALGGTGNTGQFGHAGDFEGEFADILRSIDRSRGSGGGDGYDALRARGKKTSALERSRGNRDRRQDDLDFGDDGEDTRWKKKAKYDQSSGGARQKPKGKKGRR